jgi:polysaccharide biosynthesis/export protein
MNKSKIGILFTICIGCTLFFSCVPQRKIILLQHKGKVEADSIMAVRTSTKVTRIQKADEVYVRVNSLEENERYNFFNTGISGMSLMNSQAISLAGHVVDRYGNITFPVVGDIKIEGLTLDEAGKKIQETVAPYINKPTVTVRIINKNVTILGFVRTPGQYEITHERMNVLQAIGRAGDITDYGNRRKVLIIREQENKIERKYVDLTKDGILASDFYYLKPGDIIYVEPMKRRLWGINNFPFAILLSAATTTVLILNYIYTINRPTETTTP